MINGKFTDTLIWRFNEENGVLYINGTGSISDDLAIPKEITENIKKINLSSSSQDIMNSDFFSKFVDDCPNLRELIIPENTKLNKANIPYNIKITEEPVREIVSHDGFYEYYDDTNKDTEEDYRRDYNKERDETNDSEDFGRTGGSYDRSESSNQNNGSGGNWNPNNRADNKKIYKKYGDSDAFAAAQIHRIEDYLIQQSNVQQIDVVKSTRDIHKVVNASGLIVASRRKILDESLRQIKDVSSESGKNIGAALIMLYSNQKIQPGQFTDDAEGLRQFKEILDEELTNMFKKNGYNIKPSDTKKLKKLLASKEIDGDLAQFAEASLVVENHLKRSDKLVSAKGKQISSVESLVNRLMGDDVDVWNGAQYITRTIRSIKKIIKVVKKIKRLLEKGASSASSAVATVKNIATSSSTVTGSSAGGTVFHGISASKVAVADATSKTAVAGVASKTAIAGATASGGTAIGATATGGATVGGVAAGGSAAGGTAAGGAAAGGAVAAIGCLIVALILGALLIVSMVGGAILSAFHGDIDSADQVAADAEGHDSMMYKCFEILKQHDLDNANHLREDWNYDEVVETSINPDVIENVDFSDRTHPITGRTSKKVVPVTDTSNNKIIETYDGLGNALPLLRSNARDILSAATVLVGNDSEGSPQTLKRYVEQLWYDTHKVYTEFVTNSDGDVVIAPCKDGCCSETYVVEMYWIEDDGEYVKFLRAIDLDSKEVFGYGRGINHYLEDLNDRLRDKTLYVLSSDDGITWTKMSARSEEWLDEHPDYEPQDRFKASNPEEGEFTLFYRFCTGHAQYKTVLSTCYIDDNKEDVLESSLFKADSFTNDPANADFWNGDGDFGSFWDFANIYKTQFTRLKADTEWNGNEFMTVKVWAGQQLVNWTLSAFLGLSQEEQDELLHTREYVYWDKWTNGNKEWALQLYEDDWYDLYGISFADIGFGGDAMDSSQIGDLTDEIEDEAIAGILRFALGTVGKIPYYWGGKISTVYEGYESHTEKSVGEFLAEYYPYLGTERVTIGSNGLPASKGYWYGCGGVDSRRNIIGLDCSGWVCFVYNNFSRTTGVTLGGGTGDLKEAGVAVNFEDLQPGDLLIDDPDNAHVVIFVKWDDKEAKVYSTVESAGSSGAVAKSGVTKRWDYYRRIIY